MSRFRSAALIFATCLTPAFAQQKPATKPTTGPYPIDPASGNTTSTPTNPGDKIVVKAPPNAAADAKAEEGTKPKWIRVSGGVMAGQLIYKTMPVVPKEARCAHVGGSVVMRAVIGTDGTVKDVSMISGPQLLQQSYTDAARQWRYRPYLLNGEPIEVETTIMLNLEMNRDGC